MGPVRLIDRLNSGIRAYAAICSAAGEDSTGAQLATRDKNTKQPGRGGDLIEGEWKTKLANPFKPLPIPR